jgi:hypothetical protein
MTAPGATRWSSCPHGPGHRVADVAEDVLPGTVTINADPEGSER